MISCANIKVPMALGVCSSLWSGSEVNCHGITLIYWPLTVELVRASLKRNYNISKAIFEIIRKTAMILMIAHSS